MHLTLPAKHWVHYLHDELLRFEHTASVRFHSRCFWIGVGGRCAAYRIDDVPADMDLAYAGRIIRRF